MPHVHHSDCAAASKEHRASEVKQYQLLLLVTGLIAVIQSIGGWLSGSIALWSDTLHVLMDGAGEGIALYVAYTVHTKKDAHQFRVRGMRASGAILFVVVCWNAYEALGRFSEPPPVAGWQVVVAAGIGTALNAGKHSVIAHDHSPNAKGERLHIVQDMLIGLSVIVGGALTWATGWRYVDPILSLLIAAYLAWSTLDLIFNPPKEASACGHSH